MKTRMGKSYFLRPVGRFCCWICLLALAIPANATVYYVRLPGTCTNTILQLPYTNWDIAATQIQWAVNAATTAGDTVLVSNGTYYLTNEITVSRAITIQSVNGRDLTIVDGNNYDGKPVTNRCFNLDFNSTNLILYGFTITNGYAKNSNGSGVDSSYTTPKILNCRIKGNYGANYGGGVRNCTLTNCVIAGNSSTNQGGGMYASVAYNCAIVSNCSYNGGGSYSAFLTNCTIVGNVASNNGGGMYVSTLYNCTLVGNMAIGVGGGSYYGTLYNCTLVGNSASANGGGARNGILYNCIVYNNWTPDVNSNYYNSSLTNCCTTPAQAGWAAGNITNDPIFVANGSGYGTNHVVGNYRLNANSPCVNTGTNQSWMMNAVDLDGRMRIRYGTVDRGAYERIYDGTIYCIP